MKYHVRFTLAFKCEVEVSQEDILKYTDMTSMLVGGELAAIEKAKDIDAPQFSKLSIPKGMTIPEYIDDTVNIIIVSKIMPHIECTVPDWSLSYLFNGDHSGIDDNEKEKIDVFVKGLPEGGTFVLEDGSEPYFYHDNDIDDMAGNVYDVKYYYDEKDGE